MTETIINESYVPYGEFRIEENNPREVGYGEFILAMPKGNSTSNHAITREDALRLASAIVDAFEPIDPADFDPLLAPLQNALEAAGKAHLGEADWDEAPALVKFHVKDHLMAPVSAAVRVAVAQTEASFLSVDDVEAELAKVSRAEG